MTTQLISTAKEKNVAFANSFNSIIFKNFTATELNFLMTIVQRCKDKGSREVVIPFKEIKLDANFSTKNKKRFVDNLLMLNQKLGTSITMQERGKEYTFRQIFLFSSFRTSLDEETLTVVVNKDYEYLFNGLTANFTKFELAEFVRLDSKYSKELYSLLKQYKTTGVAKLKYGWLKKKLSISESYTAKNVTAKIIEPCVAELRAYFPKLKVKTVYKKERGKPIDEYVFIWETTDDLLTEQTDESVAF